MEAHGTVEAIFLAARNGEPAHAVPSAVAHPGRGLEGDRHFDDAGACDITLIELEAIEAARTGHGLELAPGESRRQVQVRGVNLRDFIGRRFRVGEIECLGEEHCEPCHHLAGVLQTQVVLKGLLHTGLRASIIKGGTIRAGDVVELVAQPAHAES
ncbi:MAG TPA: MOSC domain-containing protein [Candidatus Dormibacteraeota bacterium]|jgi:MOSC domain-containing protein YiiM